MDDTFKVNDDLETTYSHLERSLMINPSLDNSAWSLKMELLSLTYFRSNDKDEKNRLKTDISEHIKLARTRNPEHPQTLDITEEKLRISCEKTDLKGFLELLTELKKKSSTAKCRIINSVIARSFEHIYDIEDNASLKSDLKVFVENHNDSDHKSTSISLTKIRYWLSVEPDNELATAELEALLKRKHIGSAIVDILKLPMNFTKSVLNQLIEKLEVNKQDLFKNYYFETLSDLHLLKKDYALADQHLETAYKEGMSFKSYMASKTYLLLLTEEYNQINTLASRHSARLDACESDTIMINIQFAAKKTKHKSYSELILRNMIAQSSMDDVKICAFSLLNQSHDAKRLIKKKLVMDSGLIFKYKRWPALSEECFPAEAEKTEVA